MVLDFEDEAGDVFCLGDVGWEADGAAFDVGEAV